MKYPDFIEAARAGRALRGAGLDRPFTVGSFELRNAHLVLVLISIFLISNGVFSTYLQPLPRAVLLAGCVASFGLAARHLANPATGALATVVACPRLLACLALGCALTTLGGVGHLVYANSDWLWRDAVLADLSRSSALPSYAFAHVAADLRAPIGMYMIPAVFGRLFGLEVAECALWVQNSLCVSLLLYGFSDVFRKRRLTALAIVVGFGGADVLGCFVRAGHVLSWGQLPSHINAWLGVWQYSSPLTQIFWAPNHALPGWFLASVIVMDGGAGLGLEWLGLGIAMTMIWSPLSALGAMPFLLAAFLQQPLRNLRSGTLWIHAGVALAFVPVALFITSNAGSIDHGFSSIIWTFPELYFIFIMVELTGPVLLALSWPLMSRAWRRLFGLSLAVLLCLPLVKFGAANDIVMRSSIPALMILSLMVASALSGEGGLAPLSSRMQGAAMLLVFGVGLFTPAAELARAVLMPSYRLSACNFSSVQAQVQPGQIATNYLIPSDQSGGGLAIWSGAGARLTPQSTTCWPDRVLPPGAFEGNVSNADMLRLRGAAAHPR